MKKFGVLLLLGSYFSILASLSAADSKGELNQLTDLGTGQKAQLKLHDNGDGTKSPQVHVSTPIDVTDSTLNLGIDDVTAAPGATPTPSPARALMVQPYPSGPAFAIKATTPIPVTLPSTQYTIVIANVTTGATISAGKHHIEFILSTDFSGTIGGVTIPAALGVYSPGDAPPGASLGALTYTVSAGSAILTTW